jgi:hypothetical protein
LLEPVQALVDAFQLRLHSYLGIVLVRVVRQVPFLVCAGDEGRGDLLATRSDLQAARGLGCMNAPINQSNGKKIPKKNSHP